MTVTSPRAIMTLLVGGGVLNAPGSGSWPVTIGNMPADGDQYVTIRATGGYHQGKHMTTGKTDFSPDLQLMIRAVTHGAAELKGNERVEFLSAVANEPVTYDGNVVTIHNVMIITFPTFVKQEEQNRRQLYSINIRVTLSEEE
jgi:uncharacterized protein with beta-barrel porin domain